MDRRLLGRSAHPILRSNRISDLPFGPTRRWTRDLLRVFRGPVFSGALLAIEALEATTCNAWNDDTPVNQQAEDRHRVRCGGRVSATLRSRSALRAIRVWGGAAAFQPGAGAVGADAVPLGSESDRDDSDNGASEFSDRRDEGECDELAAAQEPAPGLQRLA